MKTVQDLYLKKTRGRLGAVTLASLAALCLALPGARAGEGLGVGVGVSVGHGAEAGVGASLGGDGGVSAGAGVSVGGSEGATAGAGASVGGRNGSGSGSGGSGSGSGSGTSGGGSTGAGGSASAGADGAVTGKSTNPTASRAASSMQQPTDSADRLIGTTVWTSDRILLGRVEAADWRPNGQLQTRVRLNPELGLPRPTLNLQTEPVALDAERIWLGYPIERLIAMIAG